MKKIIFTSLLLLVTGSLFTTLLFAQTPKKTRLLVLSDIEADPDDSQSLVRFLTYAPK